MDLQSIIHWIYVAGMAIGALHFWSLSRNGRGVPSLRRKYFSICR
jgi:bacteriorhodopsin